MDWIVNIMMDLLFPIIVIVGVTIFLIKAPLKDKLIRPLRNQKVLFGFLILWTLIGFFTRQDFSESCGCLIGSRGIFSPDYVLFSAISLILLILAFILKNKLVRISLLCIELFYWLFKLFALKSGYVGGLGILVFKYYDFISLLARLLLINSLLGYRFKEYLFALISGLLIIIKMLGFPCRDNFIYRDYLNPYYTQQMFEQLNGSWTGLMIYSKDSIIGETIINPDTSIYGDRPELTRRRDTIVNLRISNVHFTFNDSILTIEKANPDLNGQYCLTYSRPESKCFIYLPRQYIDDAKRDYHFNQYSKTMFFENISDSTLSCNINYRIEVKLKTTGNRVDRPVR